MVTFVPLLSAAAVAALPGRNQPRTLLEQLIQQREHTLADAAREFEALANQLGEPATMSPRRLRRWLSGEASNAYRPRDVSRSVCGGFRSRI